MSLVLASAGPASAQAPPRSGLETLDRERAREVPEPRSRPKVVIDEDRRPAPGGPTIELALASLSIDGVSVFDPDELLEPYRGLLGRIVSYEDLEAIANDLTRKYRDSGYLLSRVVLPPQEVDQGAAEVRLVAVEGFIHAVEYEGDPALTARFRKRFAPVERRLLAQKPLWHPGYERAMLLLQDTPGLSASSFFKAAPVQAGTILVLEVETSPVSASVAWSNSGTESAGPGILSANLSIDSWPILGLGTSVQYARADNAKEYQSLTVTESYRLVGGLGLSASLSLSRSPEPDSEFARLFEYQTSSRTLTLKADYPVIRTRDLNLAIGLTYEHRDGWADLLSERFSADRLRTLSLNVDLDFSDELGGVNQIFTTLSQGLDVFDATDRDPLSSNSLAPARYFKADVLIRRDQRLPADFSVVLTAEAMASDRVLSSYNKFSLGGGLFGRGYDPGVLEGDKALAFSVEPRWTRVVSGRVGVQPFAFIDYGTVWSNHVEAGEPRRQSGGSFGGGLRLWGHVGPEAVPDFQVTAQVGRHLRRITREDSTRFVLQASLTF